MSRPDSLRCRSLSGGIRLGAVRWLTGTLMLDRHDLHRRDGAGLHLLRLDGGRSRSKRNPLEHGALLLPPGRVRLAGRCMETLQGVEDYRFASKAKRSEASQEALCRSPYEIILAFGLSILSTFRW
jgi:hypothetical protein